MNATNANGTPHRPPLERPTRRHACTVTPRRRRSSDGSMPGNACLIDVREPDEHARERIAGSKLLPLSRFDPLQAEAMASPGRKIVLHCRSGRRSADACRMASSLIDGGAIVVNMTGGIEAWKKDALHVEINRKVSGISVMRQVQMVIGTGVLAGSALAWFVDPRVVAIPAFFGAG